MPNTIIYEDQENRIPANARKQNKRRENSKLSQRTNASTVNNSKRTVLGSLNVASNLRVQPTRAAKQNQLSLCQSENDENVGCKQKSFASTTSSFTLYSDSQSSSTTGRSSLIQREPALSFARRKPKNVVEDVQTISDSEEDDSLETVSRLQRSYSVSSNTSVMDISIVCEDDDMVIETPVVSAGEEVLESRDEELYDVTEYHQEIYNYLREAEKIHKARPSYMLKQTDITYSMRWILVDWLVEVSEEYNLHTETLYLAISYIDRFLSHMSVKRDKLQLVGTTAMFIASKYEEIYPPDVNQFAYITNNTYKVSQILRMEHLILKVLSFDMAVPTCYVFVNKYVKLFKYSEDTLNLALFLAELSMLDGDPFLRYMPSLIAASALALANHTQGKSTVWPQELVDSTRYSLEDLKECFINLKRAFTKSKSCATHAIRDKYRSTKFNAISNLCPKGGLPWDVGVV